MLKGKQVSDAIVAYRAAKTAEKEAKEAAEAAKKILVAALDGRESDTAQVGKVTFTVANKPITTTRLDADAVKADFPDWKVRYGATTTTPRFTIK